jgi:hypothetical protein
MKYLICFICPPIACCMAGRVDKAVYQFIVALVAAFVVHVFSFVMYPIFVIWAWKVCADSDRAGQNMMVNSQRQSTALTEMKLLIERQHRELLQATNPKAFEELLQREEAERVAKAKAREEQRVTEGKETKFVIILVGALIACIVAVALITPLVLRFTRSAQPTQSSTISTVSTEATPRPTSEQSIVNSTPSPTPGSSEPSTYIPDPSDGQALAAFNDLQDQFGRPHADRVSYYAKDDSYHWIGPKYHKPMKLRREEFDLEVWNGYYKKLHP